MTTRSARLALGLVAATLLGAPAFAKPKKEEPAPPPGPPPAATPAPAPEPAPPAEPVPESSPKNADFSVTLAWADGRTKTGKVTGVQRTEDFFGDEGWTTTDSKLRFTVEGNGTEKQVAWKDVKSITVVPGKIPDDVDCTYSSDFNPWMYDCTLRTTTSAVLKDGSKGTITNRHKWRLWFDDGSKEELQVYKYSVREQDSRELEFGDEQGENFAIYTKLQGQIRTDIKGALLKSVTLN